MPATPERDASGERLESETLLAFVEARAPSPERARVERHVARCATCRAVLSERAAESEVVASARHTESGGSGLGAGHAAGPVLRSPGEIDLRLQKPARALESLESLAPARRRQLRPGEDPGELALTTALIARARFDLGRERERGRALALEAHADMKADERMTRECADFGRRMRKQALR
ncbi:MAG TPA: hypothetical protein VFS43_35285 [Polyangiaceae bacterium]|nr:hypothetical protein [Polyangiaceae bacterium]